MFYCVEKYIMIIWKVKKDVCLEFLFDVSV